MNITCPFSRLHGAVTDPIPHNDDTSSRVLLHRADQAVIATILFLSLFSMAGYWIHLDGHRGRLIEIDEAEPVDVEYQVDINQADWPELTQLPGIGKTLARRIVDSRNTEGSFIDHQDLRRVRGIGSKTLDRLEPYLLPMPTATSVAGP